MANNYTDMFNNSIVNTTERQNLSLSDTAKLFFYIAYGIIFSFGTIGNAVVIYVIGIKTTYKKNYDIQILSLSVADILASLCVPIVNTHDVITNNESWELFGTIGCKILLSANHLTILVSSLTLALISITRFQVIKASETFRRSRCKTISQIIFIWFISLIVVAPYIHVSYISNGICQDNWDTKSKFVYFCVLESMSCIVPIATMTLVYSISSRKLQRRDIPGDNISMSIKRKRQNKKISSMFRTIVIIFFCLTTPYMIYVFASIYTYQYHLNYYLSHEAVYFYTGHISYTVSSFNNIINPLIYAKMHRGMKKVFRRRYLAARESTLGFQQRPRVITEISQL